MGHASLRYLRAFPVDKIKIDRSLTDLDSNSVNEQIVRSVIALCHGLNIATIVEGVELREQVDRFMNLGCTIFQGYYYSKPAPGELCLEIIRQTCRKTSALGESRSPAD
jgi:EAL domain-containing protein (putative c-di-GMP-specific phosphodiesterase class I)